LSVTITANEHPLTSTRSRLRPIRCFGLRAFEFRPWLKVASELNSS
jgi:hypothetical protein